jgi:hypothetical protein
MTYQDFINHAAKQCVETFYVRGCAAADNLRRRLALKVQKTKAAGFSYGSPSTSLDQIEDDINDKIEELV